MVLALMLIIPAVAAAGMKWQAYTKIRAKTDARMTDVLEYAGPPDMMREDVFAQRIFLYYLGRGAQGDERPTTVVISGRSDRVISIRRDE